VHRPGNKWDPLVWNSCRADTAELNIFPVGLPVPTSTGLALGHYMTTIHESDPKFSTLGVDKFRCFVVDTSKAATSGPIENNVVCDGTVPAWLTTVPPSRTGWDGSASTKEFTSIIPDGLLTPGSHVQYFYRKSLASDPLGAYAMTPDTNFITPQPNENDVGGSFDMHRWQQFSVLPDRWKSPPYGGDGGPCWLYVDWCDRRGVEGRFVSVLDSIGETAPVKFGAHNGWHAPGTTSIVNLDVRTNPSVAVGLNAQSGSDRWDMYGVKGGESATMGAGQLGSRLANRSGMGYAAGRESRQGPTPEMLRLYYLDVAILTGDLHAGIFGPLADRSQNDIALLKGFLTTTAGPPRGLLVQGSGFVEAETASGATYPTHTQFLA